MKPCKAPLSFGKWRYKNVLILLLLLLSNEQGEYRQFVSNRVAKIKERDHIHWHHVPTEDNPADIGSRGGSTVSNELWTNGPE